MDDFSSCSMLLLLSASAVAWPCEFSFKHITYSLNMMQLLEARMLDNTLDVLQTC